MKKTKLLSIIVLSAIMTGCGGGNKQAADEIVTVDVSESYPDKELILQDFTDVEYIPLETNDEFITEGRVQGIGKNIILVTNRIDGNIFVFDRTGKALRVINRIGQGGEEYTQITSLILDEENNEMFVVDYPVRKISVYDLEGNFKRSFGFQDTSYYNFTFDYDRDNLICYKGYPPIDTDEASHVLISKKDGSVTRKIKIPVGEIKTPVVTRELDDMVVFPSFHLTTPFKGNWVLHNTSSDTIYKYSPDDRLTPLIVRTPSIHSMETEVFLFANAITDRYYFMRSLTKKFNFDTGRGFETIDLVYDKQDGATYKPVLRNDDFEGQQRMSLTLGPVNHEIVTHLLLQAYTLVEANEEGKLKGRLKEIADGLDDEDANPVIMLIKQKK